MLDPKKPEAQLSPRRKLLLVGAESHVQSLMSPFLRTMGWTCTAIQDREEAPTILEREVFDAVVIDPGRSAVDAERTILKIKEMRPSLGERILVISSNDADGKMLELMERYGLIQLSQESILPQLWATLQFFVSPRSREIPPRGMQPARMIFDSFQYPLPGGVRGLSQGARHLAYQHKRTVIDVSLEFVERSGHMSVAGQVLDGERKGKSGGLPVLLVSGAGTVVRTCTNELGEFNLECEFPADASLEIRIGERSWVAVPLGKMDWARKKMAFRPGDC